MREFVKALRYWRGAMALRELGSAVHVSKNTMSRYLNGVSLMPLDTLEKFCEVLKIPAAERERLVSLRKAAELGTEPTGARIDESAENNDSSSTTSGEDSANLPVASVPAPPNGAQPTVPVVRPPLSRWRRHRTIVICVLAFIVFAVGACAIPFWTKAHHEEAATATAPSDPPVWCAYVTKEPAVVYAAPDTQAKEIKKKAINDGITVLSTPDPLGWVLVSTPHDVPRQNWMRAEVLSAPTPRLGRTRCPGT